jgi:hypothetical protein
MRQRPFDSENDAILLFERNHKTSKSVIALILNPAVSLLLHYTFSTSSMKVDINSFDLKTIFGVTRGEKRRVPARMTKFQVVAVPATAGDRPALPDNSEFPPGLFLLVEKQSQRTSEDVASNNHQRKRQWLDNKGDTTLLSASMTHLQHLFTESLPVMAATKSNWALSGPAFAQGNFQQRYCYHCTRFTGKFSETGKEYLVEDKDIVMWTMTSVATGLEDCSIRLLQVS